MNLSSVEGDGIFQGKCRNCGKVCRYRAKECKKCKGNLHSGKSCDGKRGNTNIGSSNKMCNFYGIEGHNEAQCYKKNPKKAPEWWREKNVKAESAMSSVEIV